MDWILTRSGGNSMIGYLNNRYLEGQKTRPRLMSQLIKQLQSGGNDVWSFLWLGKCTHFSCVYPH